MPQTYTTQNNPALNPDHRVEAPELPNQWQEADASVQTQLQQITGQNSPLMQQAATYGSQTANRRGLLNSSMGVQAAQAAVLDRALPIASQDAAQLHQRNLSSQEAGQARGLLSDQLSSQERTQARDLATRYEISGLDRSSAEGIASLDRQTREMIATLDRETNERIATMNVVAHEREKAAAMAATVQQQYAAMFQSIMQNTALPAGTRDAYLQHIAAQTDSGMRLVEQMYGIELEWASALP